MVRVRAKCHAKVPALDKLNELWLIRSVERVIDPVSAVSAHRGNDPPEYAHEYHSDRSHSGR